MSDNDKQQHCHRVYELIHAYADNELSQQQSQYVSVHLDNCASCKAKYEELKQMKQAIKGLAMPEMESDKIEAILNEPVSKWSQHIGFSALIIGVTIVVVLAVITFFFDSSIGLKEKIIMSLIWGGLIGIILSVARQQWIARKTDKYKGVKL